MKLSTRARYGLRAIVDLATYYNTKPVMLKDIAKRENISLKYLEQIMIKLTGAGIVQGIRGLKGGFVLSKPANEITLYEIIKALEGSLSPVGCIDQPKLCKKFNDCVTKFVWQKLKNAISDVLNSITLEDIVQQKKEKNLKNKSSEYFI